MEGAAPHQPTLCKQPTTRHEPAATTRKASTRVEYHGQSQINAGRLACLCSGSRRRCCPRRRPSAGRTPPSAPPHALSEQL